MKIYAVKHIPTGLYLVPSRTIMSKTEKNKRVKSNLSKKPKLHTTKPTKLGVMGWYGYKIYSHLKPQFASRPNELLLEEDIDILEMN